MALKFDVVKLNPVQGEIKKGELYQVQSTLLVEGIGAKVSIKGPKYHESDILISTSLVQFLSYDKLDYMHNLSDLPETLYLEPGEKIYATSLLSEPVIIKVVHYLDESP